MIATTVYGELIDNRISDQSAIANYKSRGRIASFCAPHSLRAILSHVQLAMAGGAESDRGGEGESEANERSAPKPKPRRKVIKSVHKFTGCRGCMRKNHARPPQVIILEFGIDEAGNPILWEFVLRREKVKKIKEPNAIQYRRIEDARVNNKGEVVFGDLDYTRRPTTEELSRALGDMKTGRKTALKVWARRASMPGKRRTRSSAKTGDESEAQSEGADPPAEDYFASDPCKACGVTKAPHGFRHCLIVSSSKSLVTNFHSLNALRPFSPTILAR